MGRCEVFLGGGGGGGGVFGEEEEALLMLETQSWGEIIPPNWGALFPRGVWGRLANMTSGQAFIKLSEVEGLNLTPLIFCLGKIYTSKTHKKRYTLYFSLYNKEEGEGFFLF